MFEVVSRLIGDLSSYFTEVQVSFIKYVVAALLFTSTSLFLVRRSYNKESISSTTKKPKTRIKKSKSKTVDERASSLDDDRREAKRPAVLISNQVAEHNPNPAPVSLQDSKMTQNLTRDVSLPEENNDQWVTVKRSKKGEQQTKSKSSSIEPVTVVHEVVKTRSKNSVDQPRPNKLSGGESRAKKLPRVPHIPSFSHPTSESDGEWHEVKLPKKGRKIAKN
uniref:Uncharacterized protein n=1 Tax=Trichobilharzia regenti TaxID=157069 RepID=A0AA85JEP0_TRIRE|nr:unnamed protein product [Trichobilharzia regenti]